MDKVLVTNVYGGVKGSRTLSSYRTSFAQRFSNTWRTLDAALAFFAVPSTLRLLRQRIRPHLQPDFADLLVWMMRRDFLRQLGTYFYLLVPDEAFGHECQPTQYDSRRGIESAQLSPTIPIPLSLSEERFLKTINDDSPEFALFSRLCPYFRGQHSVQEILWREDLGHQELEALTQKFGRWLLVVRR